MRTLLLLATIGTGFACSDKLKTYQDKINLNKAVIKKLDSLDKSSPLFEARERYRNILKKNIRTVSYYLLREQTKCELKNAASN